MENKFTKQYTLYIKGIAVLILLWHHLFWHDVIVPVDLKNTRLYDVMIPLTKTCVALFTILSGFGINESYKNKKIPNYKFVFHHIKTLLINYWWVYIPMFILSFKLHARGTPIQIYGMGEDRISNFVLDFLGLRAIFYSPTLNATWWYMEVVLVFYLCFPLFRYLMKKSAAALLLISVIPVLLGSAGIVPTLLITTDRELYYVFPFVIGMILSEKNILNKAIEYCRQNVKEFLCIVVTLLYISAFICTQISLISHTFLALSIILLGIVLISLKIGVKIFSMLGRYSMDIFLMHSFIYYYFMIGRNFLGSITNIYIRYIVLLVICLVLAILLEFVKGQVNGFINYCKSKLFRAKV